MANPFVDVRLPAVALCSFVLSVLHLENTSCETIRPGMYLNLLYFILIFVLKNVHQSTCAQCPGPTISTVRPG